jgi:Domain of unknown function (DUF1707)
MAAGDVALRTRHPHLRASDEERERAVEELRRHYAAGRLTAAELEERVAHAYRARTRGDLIRAFEALPRRRRPLGARVARAQRSAVRLHAAAYVTANGSLVGVWALTGEGRFWPAQSLLPWGVLLGWHLYAYRRWLGPRSRRGAA